MLQTPTPGYTALREQAARIDDSARGRIRMTGEDRARLLHAMTTNDIQDLKPGQGCYVLFLNAQGRIQADANVLCFEDSLLLDTEPEQRSKIYEHLDRYIIADDVTLEDITSTMAAVTLDGPKAATVIEMLGAPIPAELFAHAAWGAATVQRISATAFRLFGEIPDLGVLEASPEEARTVRIEQGRPRYGEEITERYLVQEAGVMQAVSFTKGCYLGQEIVERVRSRGQVHKQLRAVEIDTDQPPEPGSKLTVDGAEAGEIVSSAFSPALGKTVAMAYMRTPAADPGTALLSGASTGRVRVPAQT
ncbi:MAG: glycine cleavage T C-terminal barrel domain-containing protein [Bryobacteraceae bacterium]